MEKKLLIYNSGGGLGDSVQIVNFLLSVKNLWNDHEIHILESHNNYYFKNKLKNLNLNFIKYIDLKIQYFGFRLSHYFKIKKYIKNNNLFFNVIIDLQTKLRNTCMLKIIPHDIFISSTLNNFFSKPKINSSLPKDKNIIIRLCNNINFAFSNKFKKIKFNTDIIDQKYHSEIKKILPNNNYVGLSIKQGHPSRKKELPIAYIIQIAQYLLTISKIPVFLIQKNQIELKNYIHNKIPKAIFPEFETEIDDPCFIVALSKRLSYAITIDNGLMHLIGLSNIPMICIFGPTSSEKFSPTIDNIKVLDSKKLFNSNSIELIAPKIIINTIEELEKDIK